MTVFLDSTSIRTTVFYKPTDAHCYLLYTSSHPQSCRDSLPVSQLLRLRRLCQDEDDFIQQAHTMMDFFRQRLYPESVLLSALQRVLPISRQESLTPLHRSSTDRTKLVITHHPHNFAAVRILTHHLSILRSDPTTRMLFPDPPLVSYKRDRNLRDLLVRSRLHDHKLGHRGTIPCHRPLCNTCPYVLQTSTVVFPKGPFVVREGFTCVSRNVIYAIVCQRCSQAYIGETGRRLGDRFREHIYDISRDAGTPVASHFNSRDHEGVRDIRVTAILSCSSDDSSRWALENKLIARMGVLTPHGINVSHSVI